MISGRHPVITAQVLLEGLTSSPQTPIDAVSLLSAGERRMVLHTFNRTMLESPSGPYEEQTIHGMLEFWAAATPAAPAVEFEVGSLLVCLYGDCTGP